MRKFKFPSFETRKTTQKMSPCLAMRQENVNKTAQTREKRKLLNATNKVRPQMREFVNLQTTRT